MHGSSWLVLGRGLGNAKNLRHFSVNACNLYQDDNLRKLLSGMIIDVSNIGQTINTMKSKIQKKNANNRSKVNSNAHEPFTYNHKPKEVENTKQRGTSRQKSHAKMKDDSTRTFGASIETLDFSDNELNDQHGTFIVSLIKSQSERRDHELWLSSLRRSVAEEHLQCKKVLLNSQIKENIETSTAREINSSLKIK